MLKPSTSVKFGTKAETLLRLLPCLKSARIEKILLYEVRNWINKPEKILKDVVESFDENIIIRSSARAEDSLYESKAGQFTSVLNVNPTNTENLTHSINTVIASFEDGDPDNQFFVQKFISDVEMSGVIFTRDINNFTPYVTINYDDTSGLTDTITSGSEHDTKTFVYLKDANLSFPNEKFTRLNLLIKELETLLEFDALDIEFLFKDDELYLLQVRPMTGKKSENYHLSSKQLNEHLQEIYDYLIFFNQPFPGLFGDRTMFGVMPDWNPAEIIGIKPNTLALSLYKELITDQIWADQRADYGYRKITGSPLLVSLAGRPYIDIRVDFNSWLPESLGNELSQKLTNFYLDKLELNPASHDKVEFNVVYTAYDFNLGERMEELKDHNFNKNEILQIKDALKEITLKIIGSGNNGLYKADLNKIKKLSSNRNRIINSANSDIEKIIELLEDCKVNGTRPFAGVARAGFVAILLLNSLVKKQIISLEEKNSFLNSLNTVAKQLTEDTNKLNIGDLDKEPFLEKYGHLRPGTYDINLETYAENFDKYFSNKGSKLSSLKSTPSLPFHLKESQKNMIDALLVEHGFKMKCDSLFQFMKDAIEGREFAKFEFSKNLSIILDMIKQFGLKYGFTPSEMSYLEIDDIKNLYSSLDSKEKKVVIQKAIKGNQLRKKISDIFNLPQLITKASDIFSFHLNEVEPNFITAGQTEGESISLEPDIEIPLLSGKIVFIEKADPGFDWIFAHDIVGLVTMYGGANSHMAIRASELGIPAIIGCGPILFDKWRKSQMVKIDCSSKNVIILS